MSTPTTIEHRLPAWTQHPMQTEFRPGNVAPYSARIEQLERELAEALAEVHNKHDIAQELLARAEKAEAELAASNRRCERLDKTQAVCWCGDLLKNHHPIDGCVGVEQAVECPWAMELRDAKSQLARKDEALRPFASTLSGVLHYQSENMKPWHGCAITVGDLRRAAAALATESTTADQAGEGKS